MTGNISGRQQNLKVILENIKDFSCLAIKKFNRCIKKLNSTLDTWHPGTSPAPDLKNYLCETQLCHEPKKIMSCKKS